MDTGDELGKVALLDYIDRLYRYALTLTHNRADAEDLVQETYLRALKAIGRLRDDSKMTSWLFTILRNVWRNKLRERRSEPLVFQLDDAFAIADSEAKSPHSTYVNQMEKNIVTEAISKLPHHLHEIILLREYEGFSYKEIAGIVGRPIGTVMSRLGRARVKLHYALLTKAKIMPKTSEASHTRAKPQSTHLDVSMEPDK